jgi:hypothetical protein
MHAQIWESETEFHEFERPDNTNFIYIMERIQQLPPDVQIPAEKLNKLTKVTLITIAELSQEFTDAQNNVTNDQSIAAAITFARKLRSIRKVPFNFHLSSVHRFNACADSCSSSCVGGWQLHSSC